MSRLPPPPPAARSPYGPDGVPKTSTDISHRARSTSVSDKTEAAVAELPSDRSFTFAIVGALGLLIGWMMGHR